MIGSMRARRRTSPRRVAIDVLFVRGDLQADDVARLVSEQAHTSTCGARCSHAGQRQASDVLRVSRLHAWHLVAGRSEIIVCRAFELSGEIHNMLVDRFTANLSGGDHAGRRSFIGRTRLETAI